MMKNLLKKFLENDKLYLTSNDRQRDLSKIKKYHTKLLKNLTEYLFKYHYCEVDKKILRLMIHTWLNYYLQFYFLRWNFFNKIIFTNKKNNFPNIRIDEFEKKSNSIIDTIDFYETSVNSKYFN